MSSSFYTKHRARSASFYAVLLRLPSQLATVLGYVVLVRLLSEGEFGIYSLFYAVLPFLGTLISFGMENTLKRFQPEFLRNGENRLADKLSRRIGLFRLISTTIAVALIIVFWDRLAPILKLTDYREQFILFAAIIVTHFQCQVLSLSLSAHLLQKFSVGLAAMWSVVKLAGYLLVAAFFELRLETAILVDLVAYLAYYVALRIAYAARTDRQKGRQAIFEPELRRRLIRYGAFYSFNDAGTLALDTRKENFFLAGFLDMVAVGAYSFASRFNEMIEHVSPIRMLNSVIQPLFVSLDYKSNPERVRKYFTLLINVALLVRIPVLAFTAVLHQEIVELLFAGRFLEYSWLLAVIALFSLGKSIGPPITLVAQLEEKAQFILASKLIGILSIAGSILLIPRFGVLGAAVAAGMGVLLKNLFIWWFVRKLAVWRNGTMFVVKSILIWTVFVVLVLGIKRWLGEWPVLELGAAIVAAGLFFLVQIRAAMGPDEREIVARTFSGREQRILRLLGIA